MAAADAVSPGREGGPDGGALAAVVQVLDDGGGVAGAGFLVGDDHVITCAHVVRAAGHGPGERLWLAFPHLDGAPRLEADVLTAPWRAPEAQDIAVLRLGDGPVGVPALPLGAAEGSRGHGVRAFGFPAQAPSGGHFGYGVAGDVLPGTGETGETEDTGGTGPLLQLTGANDMATGFSGGPLLDEETGWVIGMVTAISAPDAHLRSTGVAYATPTESLREAWPELTVREVSPYRFLEPFTIEDARWFHGRDAVIERVLAALSSHRALLLLGPSGAGKSSLIQAGVLPALAEGSLPVGDRWLPVLARPGLGLLAELEQAGLPGAADEGIVAAARRRLAAQPDQERLLLVIDQFEELLTQHGVDGQRADADLVVHSRLMEAVTSDAPLTVILVMRDDFYPRLAALLPELLETVTPGVLNVSAGLGVGDLRAIITRPAMTAGARFEAELPERIITDILASDPIGVVTRTAPVTLLPALELTLSRLWERRRDGHLTHDAYRRLGEVTGSLATWCDTALSQLNDDEWRIAQRVLTALVRPADESRQVPAARQQLPLDTLRALAADTPPAQPAVEQVVDPAVDRVIAHLTRSRLLITRMLLGAGGVPGEPVVELIHDALIRDWVRLRDWVDEDRQFHDWLRRAEEQRVHWAGSGHPSDLLDGTALVEGLEFAKDRGLPGEIAAFLTSSRRRRQADARRRRRIRVTLAGFLALLLVAAGVLLWQRQAVTDRERLIASRQIAQLAGRTRGGDPATALRLSLAAYRIAPTPEARMNLLTSYTTGYPTSATGHTDLVRTVLYSPDGRTLASSSRDRTVRLWDVTDPRRPSPKAVLRTDDTAAIAFSPTGHLLAAQTERTFSLWDVADPNRPVAKGSFASPSVVPLSVAFSSDGKTVASAGREGDVHLWDVGDPGRPTVKATIRADGATVFAVAFSPAGRTLATGSASTEKGFGTARVRLWDVADLRRPVATLKADSAQSLAFSPRGNLLVASGGLGAMAVWDVTAPRHPTLKTRNSPIGGGGVLGLAFAPDGRTFAAADLNGAVQHWEVDDSGKNTAIRVHARLPGRSPVYSVAFSPDGQVIASGSGVGEVQLWSRAGPEPIPGRFEVSSFVVPGSPFTSDGRLMAVSGDPVSVPRPGPAQVWDLTDPHHPALASALPRLWGRVAFLSGGRTLVSDSQDRSSLALWDVNDPRRPLKKSSLAVGAGVAGTIGHVGVTEDRRVLVVEDRPGRRAEVWDVADPGHPARVSIIPARAETSFSEILPYFLGGRSLMIYDDDGFHFWDLSDVRRPLRVADMGRGRKFGSFVFNQGTGLLTGRSTTGSISMWDLTDVRHPVEVNDNLLVAQVRSMDVVNDSTMVMVTQDDRSISLWDVGDPRHPRRFRLLPTDEEFNDVVVSPDRRTLAGRTGELREKVHLWEIGDPHHPVDLADYPGSSVWGMEFSPDNRTLALYGVSLPGGKTGILLANYRPEEVYRHLCSLDGGTITPEQWEQAVGEIHPYQEPCGR
ncbi:trypsin-like peptidase domain-containing protein [Streptosporangium carneum]|uniref:Novel STAND NTPase 1 domain-containing protein n=1 Tax=Streptosporangium carneum TaxID=47481 RepID=A0A9W6I0J2_9ACTN|nr:trypsin-like peptidase domain-containing protein [Streptosporangium carneum]GLK09736.1 hypothetical protein GCM10017600_31420 [Streptosporangium carneum]